MKNRIKYNVNEYQRNIFYQMPKFLFTDEFEKMGNDAKILYMFLKDRHELSLKNNWVDKENNIYLIFTREEMCKLLKISQPTLRKALKQLKDFNLIDEQQQGLNKPNLIYLLSVEMPSNPLNTRSEKFFHSRVKNSFTQEGKILSPNNTYINNTDIINTSSSRTIEHTIDQPPKQNKTILTDCDDDDKNTAPTIDLNKLKAKLYELKINLNDNQLQNLINLSNNDIDKILRLLDVVSTQKLINNIYGWLISGLKNYVNYTNNQNYKGSEGANTSNRRKRRLSNFTCDDFDYDEIARLEAKYVYENEMRGL